MQIYMEPRAWWRLVDPLWIDPAVNKIKGPAALQALQKAWGRYGMRLGEAKHFHTELGSSYHPNTYSHYGADEGKWLFIASLESSAANDRCIPQGPASYPRARTIDRSRYRVAYVAR